jgi:AbrB family looped-hinge helix DNA binding protein
VNNGYIRKIDELGRIVIPKEVRKKLGIQDNENIMINFDDKNILISKYSYIDNYLSYVTKLSDLVSELYKVELNIYDRTSLIYSNHSDINLVKEYNQDVISNSIIVGKVKVFYKDNDENNILLCKFIVRLIDIFLLTSCN